MMNNLSPLPKFLVNRYNEWKSTTYLENSNKFKRLAELGQSPSSMVISCCDSRVHVTSIFGAEEGDFFIHRNIANLVPPFSPDGEHHGTSAAIEYAINELKIRHLIILGHTECGGISTSYKLHSKKESKNYLFINKWLDILRPAYKKISKNISKEDQLAQLSEESIKNSLQNLFKFPNINQLVKKNELFVHGLIHNISSGGLKYLNPETGKFENV